MIEAYLTIDDAPAKHTIEKLDFLISKNISAILFCKGDRLEQNKKQIQYAISEGFIIANHSFTHPNFSKINITQCLKEIKRTEDLIDLAYDRVGIKRKVKYFRYPYGIKGNIFTTTDFSLVNRLDVKTNIINQYLKQIGIRPLLLADFDSPHYFPKRGLLFGNYDSPWTIDLEDWKIKSKEDSSAHIRKIRIEISEINNKEIILMHDHDKTHKYFFNLVNALIESDVTFINPN